MDREYSRPGFEIGDNDCVVDVGGNIGSFAVLAASLATRGRVFSIEPVAANFQLLESNLRRNRLDHAVAIRAAILPKSEAIEIFISDEGSGSHSVVPGFAGPSRRREVVVGLSLEDLFAKLAIDRCDLLKMDCEGAESLILPSLSPDIARCIRKIILEYHASSPATKRAEAEQLLSRLEGLGFIIDRYTEIVGTNRGMIFARGKPA